MADPGTVRGHVILVTAQAIYERVTAELIVSGLESDDGGEGDLEVDDEVFLFVAKQSFRAARLFEEYPLHEDDSDGE